MVYVNGYSALCSFCSIDSRNNHGFFELCILSCDITSSKGNKILSKIFGKQAKQGIANTLVLDPKVTLRSSFKWLYPKKVITVL